MKLKDLWVWVVVDLEAAIMLIGDKYPEAAVGLAKTSLVLGLVVGHRLGRSIGYVQGGTSALESFAQREHPPSR